MYSFVDYFTIPPSFVSIYLNRSWIGELAISTNRKDSFFIDDPFLLRSPFPSSVATHERSRYPSVLKYSQNIKLHTLGTTSINFYIGMVNSSWNHSLGELINCRASNHLTMASENSWRIPAIHWSSTIHINSHIGHVSTFSSLRCQPSAMVTSSAKPSWDELSSCSSYLSDWWVMRFLNCSVFLYLELSSSWFHLWRNFFWFTKEEKLLSREKKRRKIWYGK